MSSVKENGGCGEMKNCHKGLGELVIAGRDDPEVLELVEEALHEIALLVEHVIAGAGALPIALGWDDRLHTSAHEPVDEGVSIKGLVGNHGLRICLGQQIRRWDEVVGLPWGDGERDGVAPGIYKRMDLRGQTTSGAAEGLVLAPLLRAPALC